MSSNQNRNDQELPQDILDKIAEYLENVPEKLMAVLCFLSDYEEAITKRYKQILRTVFNNDEAFHRVVDKLAKDTETLQNDPNYFGIMADLWNNYLKPNRKKNVGDDGQRFDFFSVLSNSSSIKTTATYNFISELSKLHPTVQNQVIQLIIDMSKCFLKETMVVSSELVCNLPNILRVARAKTGKLVTVGLVAVYLTYEAYVNLDLWWKGKISGKRCAKNIIDSIAGVAGGIGGGMAGAKIGTLIGTFILPGVGTGICAVIGTVACGIGGSVAGNKISDWATQKIFNLPKDAALENAYKFLELEYGASNDEINSNFERLTLKYHPNQGGNNDDWHKLQCCMGIIKLSKGEM